MLSNISPPVLGIMEDEYFNDGGNSTMNVIVSIISAEYPCDINIFTCCHGVSTLDLPMTSCSPLPGMRLVLLSHTLVKGTGQIYRFVYRSMHLSCVTKILNNYCTLYR